MRHTRPLFAAIMMQVPARRPACSITGPLSGQKARWQGGDQGVQTGAMDTKENVAELVEGVGKVIKTLELASVSVRVSTG